jgi:prevent-host-death family protein
MGGQGKLVRLNESGKRGQTIMLSTSGLGAASQMEKILPFQCAFRIKVSFFFLTHNYLEKMVLDLQLCFLAVSRAARMDQDVALLLDPEFPQTIVALINRKGISPDLRGLHAHAHSVSTPLPCLVRSVRVIEKLVVCELSFYDMDEIPISEFKAKCLAVLEQVRRSKKPIRITRFGKPVADVIPPPAKVRRGGWLGSMKGRMEILGDIGAPIVGPSEWEVLRE